MRQGCKGLLGEGGGLVLSRRVGETIRIGHSITVRVVSMRAGQVRLKIIAPGENIARAELPLEPPADVDPNMDAA